MGLWYNRRKGVTFILCVIRRNFIQYIIQCSPVGSLVPPSPLSHALDEEPSLPHTHWRAWGDQRQASHHRCLPRSLSSGWEAKWHLLAVPGQEQGGGSHKPCFCSYPGSSSGFMRWEGSRICSTVVEVLESMCDSAVSALDTAPHLPAKAPVWALTTTCLPLLKVGILGTSTTLCWVWQ